MSSMQDTGEGEGFDNKVKNGSSKKKKKFGFFFRSKSTSSSSSPSSSGYYSDISSAQSKGSLVSSTSLQYTGKNSEMYEQFTGTKRQTMVYQNNYGNQCNTIGIEEEEEEPIQKFPCDCEQCQERRGTNITTELLPLDTQIPLQIMSDSAMYCTIL